MTTIETLQAARELLLDRGWCQGDYTNREGRLCAVGAVCTAVRAAGDHDFPLGVYGLLNAVAGTDHLARWNDREGRSFQDVLDLFAAAIAIAEATEHVSPETLASVG